MRSYVEMLRRLNNIEKNIKANAKNFVSHVVPKGRSFRNRYKFVLFVDGMEMKLDSMMS